MFYELKIDNETLQSLVDPKENIASCSAICMYYAVKYPPPVFLAEELELFSRL